MTPQLVTIRVHSGRGRRIRLWIPLLPVLIVLSPLLLVATLVLLVSCVFYGVNPGRAIRAGWDLLSSLRGFRVEIQQGRTGVRVNVT